MKIKIKNQNKKLKLLNFAYTHVLLNMVSEVYNCLKRYKNDLNTMMIYLLQYFNAYVFF